MATQVLSPPALPSPPIQPNNMTTFLAPPPRAMPERTITGTDIRPETLRTVSIGPAAFPTMSQPTELVKSTRYDVPAAGSAKPVIFMVHGAWHTPASFDPLVEVLTARGYTTFRSHLPSSIGPGEAATATLYDDAGIVRSQMLRLIEKSGADVLVVAHSYGGVVVGEAIKEEMTREKRRARGRKGGVVGVFHIASYLVPKGGSLARPEDGLPDWMHGKPDGRTSVPDPISLFYNDIDHERALQLAYTIKDFSQRAASTTTTRASWTYLPLTYCYCRGSVAFPLEGQQAMVAMAREAGVTVREVGVDAGHFPQLSRPDEVARLVEEWVGVLGGAGVV